MLDPSMVIAAIDHDAARLDELEKAVEQATDLLNDAEQAWLEVYDKVAEALKDEMAQEERKGDPAEHTITSVARRENRVAFTNWRRARRAVELCERQLQAKRAAMSGRQSQLAALRDEPGFAGYVQQPAEPRPAWARRDAA